ncbi:ceramide synthase isoform X2 [Anolis carolinensis]|uniref:TLC domain containing 3B n=1 Tax=Anolis carolinensis TaxID=28377 RepID=A0A803SV56_ANOCA|nr:PREDICTED: protein FAM57B isoform X2 [Anolis carolinensis]|eukprot:XP_003225046.1 PREDICTED: protein FAM57B isoform X2 [Anolis carolinensis]
MFRALIAGGIVFPGLFLLSKHGLKWLPGLRWEEADAVIVSARLVSSVQAIMASTVGYIVSSSCKHIINDQHWLTSSYTQFAIPYFIYDIYAMFLCHWHKYRVKGHETSSGGTRTLRTVIRTYLHKEFLMVVHHLFMVLVCFPVSMLWRQGKGDFFLGCMLMAEVSTPFVCLGKVLILYKQQHTLLHKVNGIIMLITFFCCRILLFPYMYWVYGQYAGLPLYRVPFSIPAEYNLGSAILMAPQVYWFGLICRGAFRVFRARGATKEQVLRNGHRPETQALD